MANEEGKVKSLQKALEILNLFLEKPKWSVTEISKRLNLNKSNVHNILSTFKAMNYLSQEEESGKYQLGFGIYAFCQAMGNAFSIKNIAVPFMQEISELTGELVFLAVPYNDEVIYLEEAYPIESFYLMRMVPGKRARMFCTGIGKAMMAYLFEEEREKYILRELPAYTEYTITDKDKLRQELVKTRERGYAIDNMEHEFGVKCVAMPVLDKNRKPVAAISVSGPSLRFTQERIEEIVQILRKYMKRIEERI